MIVQKRLHPVLCCAKWEYLISTSPPETCPWLCNLPTTCPSLFFLGCFLRPLTPVCSKPFLTAVWSLGSSDGPVSSTQLCHCLGVLCRSSRSWWFMWWLLGNILLGFSLRPVSCFPLMILRSASAGLEKANQLRFWEIFDFCFVDKCVTGECSLLKTCYLWLGLKMTLLIL